jgi:hypothetical protein
VQDDCAKPGVTTETSDGAALGLRHFFWANGLRIG